MQVSYGQVKERSAAVAAAIADARSARNLASRRRAEDARDEHEAAYHRRRRKRKSDQELEDLLRRIVRVKVLKEERPRIGLCTARDLTKLPIGILEHKEEALPPELVPENREDVRALCERMIIRNRNPELVKFVVSGWPGEGDGLTCSPEM